MLKQILLPALLCLTSGWACAAQTPQEPNLAVIPAPRDQVSHVKKHLQLKEAAANASPDVVFLGDSITEQWNTAGKNVWKEKIAPLNAFNAGIGGDRTEHILWRINEKGLVFKKAPSVCVLMIGTNNTGHKRGKESAEYTAEGIRQILLGLHGQYPEMKIVLLGILPRGAKRDDALRLHNDKINEVLSRIKLPYVTYLDVTPALTDESGTVLPGISPDKLHFNEKGYTLYADAIMPAIKRLLGR